MKIIMIGNSVNDWCGASINHMAVGNAESAYKDKCVYVSDLPFTLGVGDILRRICGGSI
jgi:hypothetical protein